MRISKYKDGLVELDLAEAYYCSKDECEKFSKMPESELPADIYSRGKTYWRYTTEPDDKIQNYIMVKMALNIRTIKKSVVFFTVITAISIFVSMIAGLINIVAR